eukprot:scaffold313382_cov12-Tisochrysis_lutea.AAC.1
MGSEVCFFDTPVSLAGCQAGEAAGQHEAGAGAVAGGAGGHHAGEAQHVCAAEAAGSALC